MTMNEFRRRIVPVLSSDIWLREVPDSGMQEWVEIAAVARVFNQEMLSFVLEKGVTTEKFRQMAAFSFVRRTDFGWVIQDELREAIADDLRIRTPDFYERIRSRCAWYGYNKIIRSAGKRGVIPEGPEWFYYFASPFIQSLYYSHSNCLIMEPLSPSNRAEAERYIADRLASAKEDSLYGLKHQPFEELYDLDPSILKLMRDFEGAVCGLSVVIPINASTLSFLISNPVSSAYFTSLSETSLKELKGSKTAGYFLWVTDVQDATDLFMRQFIGFTYISHVLSSGLIVAAPPANLFYKTILHNLGFEIAKEADYRKCGDNEPISYYVMDTRGSKLQAYLSQSFTLLGLPGSLQPENDKTLPITRREKDVVEGLIKGYSNYEIAENLYVSEATIKKHLSNIFQKLEVKNRVQLIYKYKQSLEA